MKNNFVSWSQLVEEYGWVPYAFIIPLIIVSAFLLSRFVKFVLDRFYTFNSDIIKVDVTQFRFVKNAVNWIIGFLAMAAIIYTVPSFRSLAITIFAGAGIFAAILGLASQQAFSNIVSGIFIVIFKPFRVNDIVEIGDKFLGVVEDITLRHTVIRNFENRRIIIPNSKISSETIVNSSISDPKICRHYEFHISFEADHERAIEILHEEAMKHPNCIDNRTDEEKEKGIPQVLVRVVGFTDSSVKIRANIWSSDNPSSFTLFCDLNRTIKKRYEQEGIGFPYPHRNILIKNSPTDSAQPS